MTILYKFVYNHLTGHPDILILNTIRETKKSYYIKELPYREKRTRIPKEWLGVFSVDIFGNDYPVMYATDLGDEYQQYKKQLIEYLQKDLEDKTQALNTLKSLYNQKYQSNNYRLIG